MIVAGAAHRPGAGARAAAARRRGRSSGPHGLTLAVGALLSLFGDRAGDLRRDRLVPDLSSDSGAARGAPPARPPGQASGADGTAAPAKRAGCGERRARRARPAGRGDRLRRRSPARACSRRDDPTPDLASALLRKQRCAVRYPDPCWQDPLTEAYGRALAGAIRALAPAPRPVSRARRRRLPAVPLRPLRDATARRRGAAPDRSPTGAPSPTRRSATAGRRARRRSTTGSTGRRSAGSRSRSRPTQATIDRLASTPLPDDADPQLIPLETLLGRDEARFRPARSRRGGTGREPLGAVSSLTSRRVGLSRSCLGGTRDPSDRPRPEVSGVSNLSENRVARWVIMRYEPMLGLA